MAQVVNGSTIKLNSGQTIQAQQGGWYDGQQFWGGSLSQPGQINAQSNQQGAGQAVSQEVIRQTNPANVDYINKQRQQAGLSPAPAQSLPTESIPSASSGTSTPSIQAPETINLPKLYESLYGSSGIRDVESDLLNKTNAFNEQVAKIKDNPYLSEATMTGRIKKLTDKFDADTAALKNDVAMRKADIETRLNLESKQFDINNAAVDRAWDQFNSLLSSGALSNASGEDIANLTRSTGISSSMIQGAITASKKKNNPLSIEKIDDGTNIYAVAIDSEGNVVNRQILGASEPSKSGGSSKTETKAKEEEQNKANLTTDIKKGITLKSLINYYSKVLSIDEIYRLYNSIGSPHGKAKESLQDVKQGKFGY